MGVKYGMFITLSVNHSELTICIKYFITYSMLYCFVNKFPASAVDW